MGTPAQAKAALAALLDEIDGLRAHSGYPGVLNAPAAVVVRRSTAPDTAAGVDDFTLAARVMVSWAAGNETAQTKLDGFVEDVIAAVRAEPDLDGVVASARVTEVEADDLVEYPPGTGAFYLSAAVVVEVLT